MLPVAPEAVIPTVEPMPSVAPEFSVNVPPLRTKVLQFSAAPLLTLAVPVTARFAPSVTAPLPVLATVKSPPTVARLAPKLQTPVWLGQAQRK